MKDFEELVSLPERDNFPDLRCPGWWGERFPRLSSVEESLSFREANGLKYRITESKEAIEIRNYVGDSSKAGCTYQDIFLDKSTLMPSRYGHVKLYVKDRNAWSQMLDSIILEWDQLNGLNLIKRIKSEGFGLTPGRSEMGISSSVVDVHWFSANETLSPELFEAGLINNNSSVLRLLDPYKNDAKTIVQRLDSEKETIKPASEK